MDPLMQVKIWDLFIFKVLIVHRKMRKEIIKIFQLILLKVIII
jgi:hypothetical protein